MGTLWRLEGRSSLSQEVYRRQILPRYHVKYGLPGHKSAFPSGYDTDKSKPRTYGTGNLYWALWSKTQVSQSQGLMVLYICSGRILSFRCRFQSTHGLAIGKGNGELSPYKCNARHFETSTCGKSCEIKPSTPRRKRPQMKLRPFQARNPSRTAILREAHCLLRWRSSLAMFLQFDNLLFQ